MKFNTNDRIRIVPTERGVALWAEHHKQFEPYGVTTPPLVAGRVHEEQLWVVMHIFGPGCVMGLDVPFETTIEIPEPRKDGTE